MLEVNLMSSDCSCDLLIRLVFHDFSFDEEIMRNNLPIYELIKFLRRFRHKIIFISGKNNFLSIVLDIKLEALSQEDINILDALS